MKTGQVRVRGCAPAWRLGAGLSAAMVAALAGSAQAQFLTEGPFGQRQSPRAEAPRIPAWIPGAAIEPPPIVGGENEIRLAPIVACFAPGTDPRYVAMVSGVVDANNNALFGANDYFTFSSWGSAGQPVTLRWSLVPDGTSWPNLNSVNGPSTLFATLDSQFGAGNRATWVNRFTQSFARWAQLTGNAYVRVTVGGNDWDDGAAWGAGGSTNFRGDVRIGMRPLDGGGGVLAFNQFPTGGDMCLDSAEFWASSPLTQDLFFRNVIMHEHGHGLGLQHICTNDSSQLMEPFIDTGFDGPQQDDIRGVQQLYGDIFAPNAGPSVARNLGSVGAGFNQTYGTVPSPLLGGTVPFAANLSLDPANPSDWYLINATQGLALTVTVTPVGSAYQNAPQAQNGSCPGGSTPVEDALRNADFFIRVWNANATVTLGSQLATGLGTAKTVSNVILSTPGNYLIQVGPLPAPVLVDTASYRMQISATASQFAPQFVQQPAGGSFCSGQTLTLSATVTGLPAPTFQWRRNGSNIPGATGTSLNLGTLDPTEAGTYELLATNSVGTTTSNPAVVVVNTTPVITQQPQSQTVPAGSNVTFSVAVTGTVSVYQWQFNGLPIPGAPSAPSYTVNNVDVDDEGVYAVAIVGPCGTTQSNLAELIIGSAPSCYANCDGSTNAPILNALDFSCFLQRFSAGDSYANCDGSTNAPILNALDFSCFLQRYTAGCP